MASTVYFTDLHVNAPQNLLGKMGKLAQQAGLEKIDCNGKFVAVKIHFGEPGNLAYIRHNYANRMVEILQEMGGKVFLTDSSTLYSGQRSNAIDHLRSAFENGFNMLSVKAPVIIADGLKGTDYKEIVIDLEQCKTAKIGAAVANADVIVSMNHFKGHEQAGFGGALKNIGMGTASRGGKLDMHSTSQPIVDEKCCTSCRQCEINCNYGAIALNSHRKAVIDRNKCVGCGQCIAMCRFDAVLPVWDSSSELLNKKIAEYTYAALKDKPHFHISFITNVSPDCDCWASNDIPIVPDIGMAASLDPVALDQACADLVTAAPSLPGSRGNEKGKINLIGKDKFHYVHPNTDWSVGLQHAEKIGLGTRDYKLVTI
ncbi:4Fe-4S ferredoxin [Bacteroidia bacterium]|nr:4Fe-4S ferredoxin [Bacteroidia bacterium]